MLICHEFCSVENKFLVGSYCNSRGSQRGNCVASMIPLGMSLTICGKLKLLVVCNVRNALLSLGFWHFHFHILLASLVLRNALSHIEIGAYFASTCNSVGELHPVLLHISQLSSSKPTIPTYHGISIAVLRYIAIQHPSLHYMTVAPRPRNYTEKLCNPQAMLHN